ncbi:MULTISPECIES: MAPEG family protein [unclassified Pseudoalteromonas]|uniref:MAPEG family protein n=1 Tax=unclassified Pseudoalteromonas TaxID=194690 RepID=UPI000C06A1E7|nr:MULTISPECIES: MAPEG family protein [unclassified Pseudoalteromonas]MDP2635609.1 MAPEG family protein [Pseudoalteromonas sp. 1_MG-2023]PHN88898.1 hypothetical protein CSC79_15515 [Pseudoalteromonas sp. 3D05]
MDKYLLLAMFAQVLLTFTVMVIMGRRRFAAAKNKTISMSDFATMKLEHAGDRVRVADRNFINQFEMPVFFFIACLAAMQMNAVGTLFTAVAWGFVVSRIVHTLIHVGANNVKPRYYSFLLGCLMILVLWVLIVLRVFSV